MSFTTSQAEFLAVQVAGSCGIEGIRVSREQHDIIRGIIDGSIDARVVRAQVLRKFQQQPSKNE